MLTACGGGTTPTQPTLTTPTATVAPSTSTITKASTGETAIAMPLDGAAELTERTYVTAAVTVTAAVPTALA